MSAVCVEIVALNILLGSYVVLCEVFCLQCDYVYFA
jgi:hypothetical protein